MAATPLGLPVPMGEQHAVSVSLPKWEDVCDYERGAPRVKDAMQTGYPRFFVHKTIQQLAAHCLSLYGKPTEYCYLYPTAKIAKSCQDFLAARLPAIPSRVVPLDHQSKILLYAVFLDADHSKYGKEFWQHTGDGISSRYAQQVLFQINQPSEIPSTEFKSPANRGFGRNRHYSRKPSATEEPAQDLSESCTSLSRLSDSVASLSPLADSVSSLTRIENTSSLDSDEEIEGDYVEQRYGRNLAASLAPFAKKALKRRIAGVLMEKSQMTSPCGQPPVATNGKDRTAKAERAVLEKSGGSTYNREPQSTRGVAALGEEDVFLYPTGMSAIFHAHQACLAHRQRQGKPLGKSVCFGFPYTDTLKILQKWGPGAHHFGTGLDLEIPELEAVLKKEPDILSLFAEFPSNPLLRAANLPRLRALADEHGFLIVVDETVGTFANVEVLPYADIVVSSLTKIFSGDCNVMGGSLVLNPAGKHYQDLRSYFNDEYEDTLLEEDAVFLERNSRNYRQRRAAVDANAEKLCDYLQAQLPKQKVLKAVLYPKYDISGNYQRLMRKNIGNECPPGYTSLFSLIFDTDEATKVFFNTLRCEKGPSLGTNFTLACPYTILAHWGELDWAASWGVPSSLVRVSVGLENLETLIGWFQEALDKANEAVAAEK